MVVVNKHSKPLLGKIRGKVALQLSALYAFGITLNVSLLATTGRYRLELCFSPFHSVQRPDRGLGINLGRSYGFLTEHRQRLFWDLAGLIHRFSLVAL